MLFGVQCGFVMASIMLLSQCTNLATQEADTRSMSPDETLRLRITARLVALDVVVTGREGQLCNDLTREDFHITENGVPQSILNFEPPSAHPVPDGPPISSTKDMEDRAPESPVDVIVLDEMNTPFQDMAFARYALKKYLNGQPEQAQAPTMLIAVSFGTFTILHDYTQDRAAILSALDHHLTHFPWSLQRGESKYLNFAKTLGALEQVAEGSRGHAGHKNLIWVGKGFSGIDLTSAAVGPRAVEGVTFAARQAINMLRDSRVTLYSIDPTILSSTIATTSDADSASGGAMDATAPDPFAGDVNFSAIAKATGGRSFYSRNDIDKEIGESVRDGMNYYTITYRPTSASDADKLYRKIRVRVAAPGLHATYRDGYYSETDDVATTPPSRMTYDLTAAEESTMVYTGLKVFVEPKPGNQDTFEVGVPQDELVWNPDGERASAKLRIIAVALDNRGGILHRSTIVVTVYRSTEAPAHAGSTSLVRIEAALPSWPDAFRLRFVVRGDGDGRLGTADIPISGTVPRKRIR